MGPARSGSRVLLLLALAVTAQCSEVGQWSIEAVGQHGRSLQQTAPPYPFEGYWLQQNSTEQEVEGGQNAATAVAISTVGSTTLIWETIGFLASNMVKSFDTRGARVSQWGVLGTDAAQLESSPVDIKTDASGNVYILDSKYVKKFTAGGNLIARWLVPGPIVAEGDYLPPYIMAGLAVDPSRGSFIVGVYSEYGYGTQGQLFKFQPDGTVEWRKPLNGTDRPYEEYGAGKVALDSTGYIYVIDRDGSGVLRFDSNGNLVRRYNEASNTGGLTAIAVHSQMSRIFAANGGRAEVQIYSVTGAYSGAIGTAGDGSGPEEGTLIYPVSLAVDQANGKLYVADRDTFYIMRYNNGPLKPCTFYNTRCKTCINPSTCGSCVDTSDVLVDGQCRARTCTDTDDYCITCASKTSCATCKNGYSVGIDGKCIDNELANCKLTDPGCQICVSNTQCYKCLRADYSPGLSGKCEPSVWSACRGADPQCQYCKSATICNQCTSVNYIVGQSGRCQLRDNLACTETDANCQQCVGATKCSICKPGYLVGSNGRCRLPDCIDKDLNCKICVNPTFCAVCKTNFYYVTAKGVCNESCKATDLQCLKCQTDIRCKQCRAGWQVGTSGKCEKIGANTDACKRTDANCIKCASATTCATCKSGFFVTANGKCASATRACLATIPNCDTCNTATRCSVCKSGFTANAAGQCVSDTVACLASDPFCTVCIDADTCAQCVKGYAVGSNGKCIPGNSACLAADELCVTCASSTRCSQCLTGYTVGADGKCRLDPTSACLPSDPNCFKCASKTRCAQCRDNTYVVNSNGKCQKSGGTSTRCKGRDPNCDTCKDADTCLICSWGYTVGPDGICRQPGTCPYDDPQCKVCLDSNTCKTCKDSANWAVDPSTGQCTRVGNCLNADPNCEKCDTRAPGRCLKCRWFYDLIGGNRCRFWGF